MSDNHLEHFGIPGMHWGRRKKPAAPSSKDHIQYKAFRQKKEHELSNYELTAITQRAKLVSEYKTVNANIVDKGKKAVGSVLKSVGGMVLSGVVSAVVATAAKQFLTGYFKGKG
jgi:hypothetical protein